MLAICDLIYYELYYMNHESEKYLEKAKKLLKDWKAFNSIKD